MVSSRRPRSSLCLLALAATAAAIGLVSCSGGDDEVATTAVPTTIDIADNPDGGSFRLLTYNVAGLPVEISQSRPDINLPQISPKLNDYDIVVTQEDYDWWVDGGLASGLDFVNYHGRLRAKATYDYQSPQHPGPAAVGVDRPELELGDGLGTLSRLPADGDRRIPWKGCFGSFDQNDGGKADCLAMKGFQVTTLTLSNGSVIRLYNLNAEAGTAPKDQQLQAANFEQLAADIAARAKGDAVIIAGDTNLHLDDSDPASGKGQDGRVWRAFLKATGLADACEIDGCKDTTEIHRVAYRSGDAISLDVVSRAVRSDRFVDADGRDLSDNPPIEVSFSWKPA